MLKILKNLFCRRRADGILKALELQKVFLNPILCHPSFVNAKCVIPVLVMHDLVNKTCFLLFISNFISKCYVLVFMRTKI